MRSLLDGRRHALLRSLRKAWMFSVAERKSLRSAINSIISRFPLLDEECPNDAPFDEGREQAQEQEQEEEEQNEEEQEVHAAVDDPAPVETDLDDYRREFKRQVRGKASHVPLRRLNKIVRRAIVRQAKARRVPVPDGTHGFIHDNIFVKNRFCQTRAGSLNGERAGSLNGERAGSLNGERAGSLNGDDAVGRYQKTPFQVIVRRRTGSDPSIILASVEELNLVRELEPTSSLSTGSTLAYTTTPSNVNSLPGIVGDHLPFVQRLLADVNLYQGTLSIMNSDDWVRARNEALDGTVGAFRFYLLYVLVTSSVVVASHRPEFVLSQWLLDPGADDHCL
ncbi:hypothetical protein PBRA_008996 [Plasmodiophora brassicae]|uniref:Uncharacterized protein n=1 Tax=Plasmodiophora brassicae TaxID=37360 RepID=A0A0G4J4H4_PLABS|nr:hypothetical protein PBRA_008996 [Plasmodiophora brassicae]